MTWLAVLIAAALVTTAWSWRLGHDAGRASALRPTRDAHRRVWHVRITDEELRRGQVMLGGTDAGDPLAELVAARLRTGRMSDRADAMSYAMSVRPRFVVHSHPLGLLDGVSAYS